MTSIPPPIVTAQTPDYFRLNEQPRAFEKLTVALMALEPGLQGATLYGTNGQGQYGVDAVADREGGGGRAVASSKCHEDATPAKLKAWTDKFLKNREAHWTDVTLFIVAAACVNSDATEIVDQRRAEAARLAQFGIAYEFWGPEQLTHRLRRGDRQLTQQFLKDAWANEWFGHPVGGDLSAAQVDQVRRLQDIVSDQAEARVELGRDRLRAGAPAETVAIVAELRAPPLWTQLRAGAQAAVLRLGANIAFQADDHAEAERLTREADILAPAEPRMLAHLASQARGPAAGLAVLGVPTTRSGRQSQVVFHLEAGEAARADAGLEVLLAEDPDDPETLQLLAHVRLMQDRRAEALAAAAAAEARAPHWISVMRVAGMARYAMSLSPLASHKDAAEPNPTDPTLLRNDTESVLRLEGAAQRFGHILSTGGALGVDRAWRLACLANLPARLAEAAAFAAECLAANPMDLAAIAWSLARGLQVDLGPSRTALQRLYDSGDADQNLVRAFTYVLLKDSDPAAVAAILRDGLERLTGAAREEAETWIARFTAEAGGEAIADVTDPFLIRQARETGDWSRVEQALLSELGATPPDPDGLGLAASVAYAGRLELLAPYLEAIAAFETELGAQIGLHVRYRTAESAEILAFLNTNRDRYPAWAQHADVRRIELRATFDTGNVPGALRLAEKLAGDTGDIIDKMELAQLHLASGHAQAALPAIRLALQGNALTGAHAIQMSMAVTREDPDLSRALWRRGFESGLPDDALIPAVGQGHKLGLEAEVATLFPRLQQRAAAGAPDVWTVDVSDLTEMIRSFQERERQLTELYEFGVAPVHLVVSPLNVKLADFYWLEGRARARGMLRPLLIRHGGRPADFGLRLPWRQWRLRLDVTGLLIADELGLMDHLEALPNPVTVSHRLPDLLYNLEQELVDQQAARLDAARAISKAHLAGRLTVQAGPAAEASLVRHQRLRREAGEPGVTVNSIIDVLADLGEVAQRQVDHYDDDDVAIRPVLGSRLVFPDNTLTTLAMRGGLDGALTRFGCEIPQEVLDDLGQELVRADAGETRADRIGALRRRVGLNLETGVFARTPEQLARPLRRRRAAELDISVETGDPAPTLNALEQGLADMLARPGDPETVYWCDDRHITGYVHAEGARIVGSLEVLDALLADGAIDAEMRRRKILQLRAGGAAFLPLTADELLIPLRAAPVDEAFGVVETRDLAILRRNLAAAASLDARMKTGASEHQSLAERPDELPYVISTRQVVQEVIAEIWAEVGISEAVCAARAEWVWANLRPEQMVRPQQDGGAGLSALFISGLYIAAGNLRPKGSAKLVIARRRAFAAWVTETALAPRTGPDADAFLDLLAELMEQYIGAGDEEILENAPDRKAAEETLGRLRYWQFQLLPDVLQQRLSTRPAFAALLGTVTVLTVAGQRFEARPFWAAVGRALRKGSARTSTYDGGKVRLARRDGVVDLSGAATGTLNHPVFPVLAASGADRRAEIEQVLDAFDLAPQDRAAVMTRVARARSDDALVQALSDLTELSVVAFYKALTTRLEAGESLRASAFAPPPAARLRHYLRLSQGSGSVADRVAAGWPELCDRFGPQAAFLRVGGLPIPLFEQIADEADLTGEAAESPVTPLVALHQAAAAQRLGDHASAADRLNGVVAAAGTETALFCRTLSWSEMAFQSDPDWRALDGGDQLALVWAHAHHITGSLVAAGVDFEVAVRVFARQPPQRTLSGVLFAPWSTRSDCATPVTTSPATLIYHGMGYILSAAQAGDDLTDLRARLGDIDAAAPAMEDLDPGLLMRAEGAGNAMGSFLDQHPYGATFQEGLASARQAALEKALTALEETPTEPTGWRDLMRIGAPFLPPAARDRLDAVFDGLALAEVQRADDQNLTAAIVALRRALGGALTEERGQQKIYEFAATVAFRRPGPFVLGDGSPAAAHFNELVEAAAAMARGEDAGEACERLANLCRAIAYAWPAAAPALRVLVDSYIRRTPHTEGQAFWRVLIDLRRSA